MLKCGITGWSGVLGIAIRKELNYRFIPFKGRIENKKNIEAEVGVEIKTKNTNENIMKKNKKKGKITEN